MQKSESGAPSDEDEMITKSSSQHFLLRPLIDPARSIAQWANGDLAGFVLSIILAFSAAFNFLTMVMIVRRSYSALPWGDMWDYWRWYLSHQHELLSGLLVQHNEHRIAVARIFFLADQFLFHGSAVFLLISIFVLQLLHAILFGRLAWLGHPNRRTASVFLCSAAFICLFSSAQYTNFTWSFQIPFVAVYLAVTTSLTLLMLAATQKKSCDDSVGVWWRQFKFWGAIVMAIAATYSMANGLFIWPILVLEAFWFKMRRHEKIILVASSIVIWALYLWHYVTPSHHSSPGEALYVLPQVFMYSMAVLGSPIAGLVSQLSALFSIGGDNWRLVWTCGVGFAGFLAGMYGILCKVRDRDRASAVDGVIVHLLLFLAVTIILIGLGRANFPLAEALQSRYATVGLLFWLSVVFLAVSYIERKYSFVGCGCLSAYFALMIGLLVGVVLYQPTQIRYAHDAALYESESLAAVSAPVYYEELWKRIYYNPKAMISVVRFLQRNHLSVFSRESYKWVGDPLDWHYSSAGAGTCVGFVDDLALIAGPELPGLRLRGWAWNARSHVAANSVVFVDERGLIIGFGYTGYERSDVRSTLPEIGGAGVGWIGFVPGLDHTSVSTYMVLSRSAVCPLGSRSLNDLRPAELQ